MSSSLLSSKPSSVPAFLGSSTDDDITGTSSSTNGNATSGSSDKNVGGKAKDDSNAGCLPVNHGGFTTGRGRRMKVASRRSRVRAKPQGLTTSQDKPRPSLRRSTSLPADVMQYARQWKLLGEGVSGGQTRSQKGVDHDPRVTVNLLRYVSDEQNDHRHKVRDHPARRDTQHAVHDAKKTSQNHVQFLGKHAGSQQCEDTGEIPSDTAIKESSDSQQSTRDVAMPRSVDVIGALSTDVGGQQSNDSGKNHYEADDQHFIAQLVATNEDTARNTRQTLDGGVDAHQRADGSRQPLPDQNGNYEDSQKLESTSSSPGKGQTSEATSLAVQAGSSPDREHPQTDHFREQQQQYNADVSSSSSEDNKLPKVMDNDNHFVPPLTFPNVTHQHVLRSSPFFVNDGGRGYFVSRPLQGDYQFQNEEFFTDFHRQGTAMFPGYQPRSRDNQQGKYVYGAYNHNGYGYPSSGSQGKTWTPCGFRGRRGVVSSALPRRGRGGLLIRGRGGFGAGRGNHFGPGRMTENRYSQYPTFTRGGRSRAGCFGRKGHERTSRYDQRLDGRMRNGGVRHGDPSLWDIRDNEFSRGRTPYRTSVKPHVYRHRSAPPAHDLSMEEGLAHQPRLRHRSLSRIPYHSGWPASPKLPRSRPHWNYSPRRYPPRFNGHDSSTPRRDFRSGQYGWSPRQRPTWQDRMNIQHDQPGQDHGVDRPAQQDAAHLNLQNGGSRPCQNDGQQRDASAEQQGQRSETGNAFYEGGPNAPFQQYQRNGVEQPQRLDQEAAESTEQGETIKCGPEHPTAPAQQVGLDALGQTEQSTMTHVHGHVTNRHETCRTGQHYGRKQRYGSDSTPWRTYRPPASDRPRTPQWRDRSHFSKRFHQQTRRWISGPQQNRPAAVQRYGRFVPAEREPGTSASKRTNVTHWHQHAPLNNYLWNEGASAAQPLNSAVAQSVGLAVSPTVPGNDGLQADFLWKMMQLQILHEHQHVDQMEADHLLKTLMGMHLPPEASQNFRSLMSHLAENNPCSSNKHGRISQSGTAQSSPEHSYQQKYLSNIQQQGSQGFDDGINNNQGVEFQVMPQTNGNQAGKYVGCITSPQNRPRSRTHWHQVFHTQLAPSECDPRGHFQRNRRPFHKQSRKTFRESRAQYVYFLDDRNKRSGQRQVGQTEQDNRRLWSPNGVHQRSNCYDVNANLPGGNGLSAVNRHEQSHQIHSILQRNQNGQESSRQHNADQTVRLSSGSAQLSPSVAHRWSHVNDEMNNNQHPEAKLSFADKFSLMTEQKIVEADGSQTPGLSPSRCNAPSRYTAVDRANGNADPSDGGPHVQLVSNTNQAFQMGVRNFLPTGTPLQTPLLPVQFQPGPVNTPLLQPVNTPLFQPVQTPFISTMNIPYPQQNVFQFPSPLPLIPVGSAGQLGLSAPTVFQFPDMSTGHPSLPVDMQQCQHPQTPMDKPYGFAGNQPLVQLPPTNTVPADQALQPPALEAADINGNAV